MKRLLLLPLMALAGVLAAGCIIQFSTLYKDDASRTHFVGLASNLTKADVVDSVVEIKFFDSSNNLLATKFVSPCTRTLQDHQSSPVEAIIPAGVTADDTETVVHPLTFGAKIVPDLEVDDIDFTTTDGVTHLTATVENTEEKTFRAVHVCAAIFDDDGDVVRVGEAYVDPPILDEGETGDFDIAIEDMPAAAEEFQLWVDATTRSPTDVTAPVVVGPDNIEVSATATPTVVPSPTPTATPVP